MYRGLVLHLTGLGNELRRLHGLPEEEDVTPQQMMALMDSNGWRDLIPGWARAPGYDEQQP